MKMTLVLAALLPLAAGAADWPQFLGPTRDAVYSGLPLADQWPRQGPPVVWRSPKGLQIKSRGQVVGRPTRSYPALADGYAFIKGPKELVCLDLRARK
jgi:hypothetical protein